MIFSHQTCSLDTSHYPEPESAADMLLQLAACLLHELRLGRDSRWYGWLQVLPRDTVVVPVLWGVGEISGRDGEQALKWAKGSGFGKEIKRQEESDGLSLVRFPPSRDSGSIDDEQLIWMSLGWYHAS